jgi:hypothetical protein
VTLPYFYSRPFDAGMEYNEFARERDDLVISGSSERGSSSHSATAVTDHRIILLTTKNDDHRGRRNP